MLVNAAKTPARNAASFSLKVAENTLSAITSPPMHAYLWFGNVEATDGQGGFFKMQQFLQVGGRFRDTLFIFLFLEQQFI